MFNLIRAAAAAAVVCVCLQAAERDAELGKLDARLIPSIRALRDGSSTADALLAGVRKANASTLIPSADGRLPLSLDLARLDDEKLAQIAATGAKITLQSAEWHSVSALANLDELNALLSVEGIRAVRMSRKPFFRAGTVTSQGDSAIKTDQVRPQYTGNVKIGVVSEYVNQTAIGPGSNTSGTIPDTDAPGATINTSDLTGLTNQTSSDLPTPIQVLDFGPTVGPNDPVFDEGAAMLEVIHDVAPGAKLAFASGIADQLTMAENIRKLRVAGCKVIVDDVSFADEPFFQDGPIAQAINKNVSLGVTHFTAVGNEGDLGTLVTHSAVNPSAPPDTGTVPSGNFFHNWSLNGGTNSGFLPITIAPHSEGIIIVQWNQPWMTYTPTGAAGAAGPGATDSLGLILYDAPNANANILAASTDPQGYDPNNNNAVGPFGNPIEIIQYLYDQDTPLTAYLAVDHDFGTGNSIRMRVLVSGNVTFPSGGLGGMTAFGHTSAQGTISVASVDYTTIPASGAVGGVELFSSKGGIGANGIPYYFNSTGGSLGAVQLRDCPDISGPDGVVTTFFTDANFQPRFFGTSAAASHAAGLAALVLERAELTTPAQMKLLMKTTARDIVAATPLSVAGPDDRSGAGMLDGLAAITASPAAVTDPKDTSVLKGATATFSATAAGNAVLSYQWQRSADGGTTYTNIANATDTILSVPNTSAADTGSKFRVVVSNSFGAALSKAATLTVNLPPEIIKQPSDITVNVTETGTFSVTLGTGSYSYQWRKNGFDIPGATGATYTTSPVTASDDGALFSVIVTNVFGSTPSNPAKLTVNFPPAILSQPTATPSAAKVGTPILFTAAAAGTVTYTWNFGDGTQDVGASIIHAYGAAGNYLVTLTVNDAFNAKSTATVKVFIFNDNNSDGVPDLDATIDNTPFVDAFKAVNNYSAQNLDIKKMSISLNFSKQQADAISISGTLPLPANFTPANQAVLLVVGGVGRTFKLDAKGKAAATPNGTFKLQFKKSAAPGFGKFTISISKAILQKFFEDEKLTNRTVKAESDPVRVTIFFTNAMYDKDQAQVYTAKQNSMGKTK